MGYLTILATTTLLTMGALYFFRRKGVKRPQEVATGKVFCKKCGARISVFNPAKLHHEFSLKCGACDTRKLYRLVDLTG